MLLLLLLLPYLSWTKMDCCFERIRNHTLIGTVITTLDDVTLLQCQHECLEMKEQRCRSLMYYAKKSRCYMNSEDKDTRDSSIFSVVDTVDYYHRKCYHTLNTKIKQSVTVKRDSAFDDNCYEIFEGKVLIGVVDQLIQNVNTIEQCKKRCQRSKEANDLICKSAMYYKKDKECIIASMSRIDIPDLFIDDDQAVYMENICLNNRTSSTKKIQGSGKTSSEYSTGPPNIMKKTCTLLDHMEITKDISRTTVVPTPQMNRVQPVTQKTIINNVELSGYDSPSEPTAEDITTANITTTIIMSTVSTPTTTIDARMIDTYNVETPVKIPEILDFGKRLRDSRVKDCFTEVIPYRPMIQTRITKAYSLEQCTDICRICWRCLHSKKCLSVAFDKAHDLCTLSTVHIADGGDPQELGNVVYHNRIDC